MVAALGAWSLGQVEVVVRLGDGSYVVHVITSSGEGNVAVSRAFEVTGADRGGPPPGATTQTT